MSSFIFVGNTTVGKGLMDSLVAAGFRAATTVSEADFVFTFCTSQQDVEDVYFESNGLLAQAKPGACLVDLGSCSPNTAKEISAMAAVSDYRAVDAPLFVRDVQRMDAYADPTNLVALVGADTEAFESVRPLLDAMAASVEYCGLNGAGQTAKAMLTIQAAAAVVGMIESDALGRVSLGDEEAQNLFDIAMESGASGGRCAAIHDAIVEESFDGTYSVGVMMSELIAALAAADDIQLILPQTEACLQLLELVAVIGGVQRTPSILSLVYGEEATCAQHGLDWTRAEEAYGGMEEDYDDDECDDPDCHHHHGDDSESFGFGYSAN